MKLWLNHPPKFADGVFVALKMAVVSLLLAACSGEPPPKAPDKVKALSPADDGKSSEGGKGGEAHFAALQQLIESPLGRRTDKQESVFVELPDHEKWTRVKFWGVKSLFGFRYGKSHHALVGGFLLPLSDNSVQATCIKEFEKWVEPWIETFDVEVNKGDPISFVWPNVLQTPNEVEKKEDVSLSKDKWAALGSLGTPLLIFPQDAKAATIMVREKYLGAFTSYPAWPESCLVVGVAIPERGDPERARKVRDRFIHEVFPRFGLRKLQKPTELY